MGRDHIFVVKKGKKKKKNVNVLWFKDITMVILHPCGFWQEAWGVIGNVAPVYYIVT